MSQTIPSIRSLLVVPAPDIAPGTLSVSLGAVLDDSAIFWSLCPFFNESQETFGSIQRLIDETIQPLLAGRRLDGLPGLFDDLLALKYTVTLSSTIIPERTGTVSRREIFTGTFAGEEPEPELVYFDVERPLPVALATGLMTLLLKISARQRRQTSIAHLAALLDFPLTKFNPRPLHLTAPYGVEQPLFTPSLLSMGYAAPSDDDDVWLGNNGQIYQGHVRRLKAHMRRGEPKGKYLYLPLGGAYGRLYDNNAGRILGAAAGVERAVKPCTVWLEDPILTETEQERDELLKELRDFFRMRRMATKLAAWQGIHSAAAVQHVVDHQTAHTVRLDLAQFNSFTSFIDALKLCRASQLEFVLGGASTSPELLSWLGVLFGARLVYTADIGQTAVCSAEMFRTAMAQNRLAENVS